MSLELMEKVAAACVIYIGLEERLKDKVSVQHMKHILTTSILTIQLASLHNHTCCKETFTHWLQCLKMLKMLKRPNTLMLHAVFVLPCK